MPDIDGFDTASARLARRVLFTALVLALAGAAVGFISAEKGLLTRNETALAICSFAFSLGSLLTLVFFRKVALQTVATTATAYFSINLCASTFVAFCGRGEHLNVFVPLLWFFPLLAFNNLANSPAVGKVFARILLIVPVALVVCLMPRWGALLPVEEKALLGVYCLSYSCYALTINLITRYREIYVVARARAESLKVEGDILESISDCFLSLDSSSRLIYLNDSACAELAVDRQAAIHHTLSDAAPGFLSEAVLAELRAASGRSFASFFEVLNEDSGSWYDLRCFPRPDGLSVYFRNITESMHSRLKLDEAQSNVRKQAALLDKAQDAIFVSSLDRRVIYWNKGAERLYGWTSEEVIGRTTEDIFQYQAVPLRERIDLILRDGEWSGEIFQTCRDGHKLIVESRLTLVRSDDGTPQSVLAINTDITARKADEARIQHLAFYDVVTGLPNRQLLRDRLAETLATSSIQANTGVLFYIDLDDFKTLNDTMGHDIGDALLQLVALRLRACLRPGDTVARLGGDEFVVMLESLSEEGQEAATVAKAVGKKILGAFVDPFVIGTFESEITASIGATLFSGAIDTVDQLLKQTDLAMYRAKTEGRSRVCFFDPVMQTEVDARAALRSDLRRALQNNEFQLHYQPQVDSHGVVTGAEALLRWFHPTRGKVPPNEFIPLAEEAGLIVELGGWVLQTACRQLTAWAGNPSMQGLTIAVNVSVRQFLDPQFVALVRETLLTSGANPQRLKLEVTESSTMEKIHEVIAIMTELKLDGVSFSLDDFGTGYSSLAHLQYLPIDQLKIDRSFVNNVLIHAKDASIARTIIMLGSNLGLSVIAEGVETEEQRVFLEAEGCHLYQGFLYSPALPCAQVESFVGVSRASTPQRLHEPPAVEARDAVRLVAA
jgi:diguanylate cyclase (GGDEF)-like protein/PAS domain S-box-containing protein